MILPNSHSQKTGLKNNDIKWQQHTTDAVQREALFGHKSAVIWFTGLSGSGKSTVANALEQARAAGHLEPIEAFGALLVTDTCWCMLGEPVIPPGARTLMTNSGKYAHYAPGLAGRPVHFASLGACVEAACAGTASGQLPAWLQPAAPLESPVHV